MTAQQADGLAALALVEAAIQRQDIQPIVAALFDEKTDWGYVVGTLVAVIVGLAADPANVAAYTAAVRGEFLSDGG